MHECPECGELCDCDLEDMEQDAPEDCCHRCEYDLPDDDEDDWEEEDDE